MSWSVLSAMFASPMPKDVVPPAMENETVCANGKFQLLPAWAAPSPFVRAYVPSQVLFAKPPSSSPGCDGSKSRARVALGAMSGFVKPTVSPGIRVVDSKPSMR